MTATQKDVDEFINDLAKQHPEYTMAHFKTDFVAIIGRDPDISESRSFQRCVLDVKNKSGASISNSILSSTSSTKAVGEIGGLPGMKVNSGYVFTRVSEGIQCAHNLMGYTTSFLDQTILRGDGIWRWTIRICYGEQWPDMPSEFYLGAADSYCLGKWSHSFLGLDESAAFGFLRKQNGAFRSNLYGVCDGRTTYENIYKVLDSSLVTMEIDLGARTLCFFVGETKVPHFVEKFQYDSICLGVSTRCVGQAFTSVSLVRLSVPTASAVKCDGHRQKPVTAKGLEFLEKNFRKITCATM